MIISKQAYLVLLSLILLPALLFAGCGVTYQYQPSKLPSLIAFSSDRDRAVHIYTCSPDGSDVRSTSSDNNTFDGLPWWSPDGTRLAFFSNESDTIKIWTMNADGSDRKKLTDTQGADRSPRYSLDGAKIAFISAQSDPAGNQYHEVFVMNANGTGAQQLTDTKSWQRYLSRTISGDAHGQENKLLLWNSSPTWSPDGSRILFASNRDGDGTVPILYIMNADGSDQKKFGFPLEIDGTEPDWSPITNKIVFTRGSAARGEIWVMDGGSPFPTLTAKKILADLDSNRSAAWSPDGKQIVFISGKYGNEDIFIMDADGANIKRVTYDKSNEGHPTWR